MSYTFKYKRKFFWKSIKKVVGHHFDTDNNWMVIYYEEGLQTIRNWKDCEMKLGEDWFKHQLKKAEKEAKQPIQVGVD